jgi:hypothetical protein
MYVLGDGAILQGAVLKGFWQLLSFSPLISFVPNLVHLVGLSQLVTEI